MDHLERITKKDFEEKVVKEKKKKWQDEIL